MLPKAFSPSTRVVDPHSHQRIRAASNQTPTGGGVKSISEYFEIIETYAKGVDWFFRGEPRPYAVPGLPKFARDFYTQNGEIDCERASSLELLLPQEMSSDGFPVYPSCMTTQEVEIIERFREAPPSDPMFSRMVGSAHEGLGWLSFAQHYGQKTRLLDVSRDPLVALYFACQGESDATGFVWLYPTPVQFHYAPTDYREAFDIGIGIDARERLDAAKRNGSGHFAMRESPPLDNVFRLEIYAPNDRIVAQRGAFLWSPKVLSPLTQNALCIHIDAASKTELRSRLRAFGIHGRGLKLGDSWE